MKADLNNIQSPNPEIVRRAGLRIAGLFSALFVFASTGMCATNELTSVLQKALFEEEGNRNLDAAIDVYQSLVTQFDKDRQIAATAMFRLGECYRKLGRTNDAVLQYQRILQEFSEQTTLATLSRQNLAGLNAREPSANPLAIAASPSARAEQRKLLEQEIALLENKLQSMRKQVEVGVVPPDELIPTQREVLALKRQLVALSDEGISGGERVSEDPEDAEIRRVQAMIQNSPDLINGPLISTAINGQLRVMTFLLEHGADANYRASGVTPLCSAAEAGQKSMVELLLNHGARVDDRDNRSATALHLAVAMGFKAVAETLLDHKANPNEGNSQGRESVTPLHAAAGGASVSMVELLLARGANVNATDASGRTPLHRACESGHPEIVRALLAAKADPAARDNDGYTPLHAAASPGYGDIVNLLVEAGSPVNAENKNGATALFLAVFNRQADAARALLEHRADPNVARQYWPQGFQNYVSSDRHYLRVPPSYFAIDEGKSDILEMLLEHGADVVWPSPQGQEGWTSPLAFAVRKGNDRLVALLLAHHAAPNGSGAAGSASPLLLALDERKAGIVRLLLENGADPNGAANLYSDGTTPLIHASAIGTKEIAEMLLDHKADVNAADNFGNTALHRAVENRQLDIAKLLLARGANPNTQNNSGTTPLDIVDETKPGANPNSVALGFVPLLPPPTTPMRAMGLSRPSPDASSGQTGDFVTLLRQNGGLEDLPRPDAIEVRRPANHVRVTVFRKGTNDWNRFSLLETIQNCYGIKYYTIATPNASYQLNLDSELAFPNLMHVVIVHYQPGTTNQTRREVSLLNGTNGIDCSKDVAVEFGEVVEVPERLHALGEHTIGLTTSQKDAIYACLKGSIKLIVSGRTLDLEVYPDSGSNIGQVLGLPQARDILLSTSDLTRVKVSRRDPATGKTREWTVDCSDPQFQIDLRLRNGDVVEVPERH